MDLFHTLNRGVDKRDIFIDTQDHFRFIHDLFEFNDENWVNTTYHSFNKCNDIASRKIKRKRILLVEIHAFCLMPNHYHLLLSPIARDGIPRFMKKLNMGYAKYFNIKYDRKGTLFEGRYKSIPVTEEDHFVYLPFYIHFNPLDMKNPHWREGRIRDHNAALSFLNNYRWSSHLDYIGEKNFPSITNRKFLLESFGGHDKYKKEVARWLKDIDVQIISDVVLE